MTMTADFSPGALDIDVSRGDTDAVPILFQDADEQPIDLTGRTFACQLRRTPGAAVAATVTVDTTQANVGILTLRLLPAVTETLTGEYAWDLQQTVSGVVRTLLAGQWIFDRDVTR